MVRALIPLTRLSPTTVLCLSHIGTWIYISHMSYVMVFFYVQWFEVRGDCSFCWYWWNCWPSLFKLSFQWNRVGVMEFNATFNNISVISLRSVLLVEETWKNHWPVASHWQTLSHNVVSSTPRHERDSNSQR